MDDRESYNLIQLIDTSGDQYIRSFLISLQNSILALLYKHPRHDGDYQDMMAIIKT